MNTIKKTITILLVISLATLAACSDDEKKPINNTNDTDISTETDASTNNTQNDADNTQKDADNTQKDADNTQKDADNTQKDADNNEVPEIDGTLALKDLTEDQVNIICNYRFDQFEPNYDPTTDAGKGQCFDEAFEETYADSNQQKPATCQSYMDTCTAKEYKREDIAIDNCLAPDKRATCEVTVDEYKACAKELGAASIANNNALAAQTCDSLATTSGQNAVEDIIVSFDYPAICNKIDENCEYMQLHQN